MGGLFSCSDDRPVISDESRVAIDKYDKFVNDNFTQSSGTVLDERVTTYTTGPLTVTVYDSMGEDDVQVVSAVQVKGPAYEGAPRMVHWLIAYSILQVIVKGSADVQVRAKDSDRVWCGHYVYDLCLMLVHLPELPPSDATDGPLFSDDESDSSLSHESDSSLIVQPSSSRAANESGWRLSNQQPSIRVDPLPPNPPSMMDIFRKKKQSHLNDSRRPLVVSVENPMPRAPPGISSSAKPNQKRETPRKVYFGRKDGAQGGCKRRRVTRQSRHRA